MIYAIEMSKQNTCGNTAKKSERIKEMQLTGALQMILATVLLITCLNGTITNMIWHKLGVPIAGISILFIITGSIPMMFCCMGLNNRNLLVRVYFVFCIISATICGPAIIALGIASFIFCGDGKSYSMSFVLLSFVQIIITLLATKIRCCPQRPLTRTEIQRLEYIQDQIHQLHIREASSTSRPEKNCDPYINHQDTNIHVTGTTI